MSDAWRLEEEALSAGGSIFGHAAVIPWDTDIFGFPAGMLRLEPEWCETRHVEGAGEAVEGWAARHAVAMCGCMVPAHRSTALTMAGQMGFRYVDLAMVAVRGCDGMPEGAVPTATLRKATAADLIAVSSIAGRAFRAGRYHADSSFPAELANLRYSRWVERALRDDEVLVLQAGEDVAGFLQLVLEGDCADFRLVAVDPAFHGGGLGRHLYCAAAAWARECGAASVSTRISASNMPVLNLLNRLGFRFRDPDVVLHRHWSGRR